MNNSIAVFTVTICLSLGASVRADDNVREVQTKLSEEGLYSGKIDGAYSSDLSEALTRYQVRNRLPITGQLDTETSEALGVKPAVTKKSADDSAESSGVWQHLRGRDQQSTTRNNARRAASPSGNETRETSTATTSETSEQTATTVSGKQPPDSSLPRQLPQSATAISSENVKPASARPAIASDTGASAAEFSPERLRDYVAAFVLAGLDRNVGAETEFFADRVEYYDGGLMDRDKIREDLKRYDKQWPERHFWVAGNITIEPQSDNRVRVTFPLGFKLRSGNKTFSGTVDKSLVLESTGDDLQIVEVKERKDE
jgi:Putative peptidoglycan binding domain